MRSFYAFFIGMLGYWVVSSIGHKDMVMATVASFGFVSNLVGYVMAIRREG